ncbi:adiponectin-like [Asterias amurensis]|uniref:adiponectin-like n=1 Tax=Asterias amurensis TaxID=7602 RepID=UPI003AB76368
MLSGWFQVTPHDRRQRIVYHYMKITLAVAIVLACMQVQFLVATAAVSPDSGMTCNSCCQGPAGQPGVKGDKGSDGLVGEPGAKGEHGLMGDQGDFNLNNGTFTCNVPGVYVLMFSVLKPSGQYYLTVKLMKNGNIIVTGHVNAAGTHQVSNSAVIPLHYGDQVHLAVYGPVYSDSDHYTSFTGFLLHEI